MLSSKKDISMFSWCGIREIFAKKTKFLGYFMSYLVQHSI